MQITNIKKEKSEKDYNVIMETRFRSSLTLLILITASSCPGSVNSMEPFSAGLAVGGGMVLSALWSSRDKLMCQLSECCGGDWVRPEVSQIILIKSS